MIYICACFAAVDQAMRDLQRIQDTGRSAAGVTKKQVTDSLDNNGCYHPVKNAFHAIDFGDEFGIYAHVGPDVLHAIDEGVLKDVVLGVLNLMLSAYNEDQAHRAAFKKQEKEEKEGATPSRSRRKCALTSLRRLRLLAN